MAFLGIGARIVERGDARGAGGVLVTVERRDLKRKLAERGNRCTLSPLRLTMRILS
ncbi:hypothetical protein [Burkholderia sp. AU28863]|uniref:hypothetical protein n=1 Tax=Burkholderia sp. AU28863 TaxID=2015352 RepID=UPI0015C5BE74|nr:hypothetical protein [Burkholderia sp. AU28863]